MDGIFWAGSAESFNKMEEHKAQAAAMKNKVGGAAFELPPVYELHGDVGVIKVEGSLIEGEAGMMRFFGYTGYQDIENGILEGMRDKKAKALMVYANSPGGSVRGLATTGDMLRTAAAVKPLNAFADMADSAGYWLTGIAPHVTVSQMGETGSIGVLFMAVNKVEAMKKEGIEVKVMRSGKYKALGNPYEPFSEEFLQEKQAQLDMMYDMFTSHVAASRGVAQSVADQVMGQGRVFIGKQGVDVGLADEVGTLETAIAYARSNKNLINV